MLDIFFTFAYDITKQNALWVKKNCNIAAYYISSSNCVPDKYVL